MMYVRMLVFALALATIGCATTPTAEGDRARRDANLLTAEEIARAHYTEVYELVRALRPAWIRMRGPVSIRDPTAGQVVVYLDGQRFGGPEQLRQLRVGDVEFLEYLSGPNASSRFGLGHVGGVILVHSKRGG